MTWRQAYQCCGQPCSNTSGGPSPASATCTRSPAASTQRWVTPSTYGSSSLMCSFRCPRQLDEFGERRVDLLAQQVEIRYGVIVAEQPEVHCAVVGQDRHGDGVRRREECDREELEQLAAHQVD